MTMKRGYSPELVPGRRNENLACCSGPSHLLFAKRRTEILQEAGRLFVHALCGGESEIKEETL